MQASDTTHQTDDDRPTTPKDADSEKKPETEKPADKVAEAPADKSVEKDEDNSDCPDSKTGTSPAAG